MNIGIRSVYIGICIVGVAVVGLAVAVKGESLHRVIDGDTIEIRGERIRIVQIDSPETWKPHCTNELALGLKAKERLHVLLDSGGEVTFKATGIDRYGRTLAHVYAGDVDVGEQLIKEKYALRYIAGPKAKARGWQHGATDDATVRNLRRRQARNVRVDLIRRPMAARPGSHSILCDVGAR